MQNFEQSKQEILARVDLLSLVSEHVTLKRTGRRWVGLCPFHSEKTPSFTVSPERGLFKCFGCGKGGDLFSFVQYRENMSFGEAMRFMADRAGVTLHSGGADHGSGPSRTDLAEVNGWATDYFRKLLADPRHGQMARSYLERRGISEATTERFSLGQASQDLESLLKAAQGIGYNADRLHAADLFRRSEEGRGYPTFRNRLMFPIRDVSGRVLGFGGRTLGDDRAKYLNTRETLLFDKGRHLYGIDLARDAIARKGRAVIVEGYTDCIAAHQAGFEEVVATLGTALTEAHLEILRRYAEEIILLFDSDRAGEAAADRAIKLALPTGLRIRLGCLPEGEDPSDFIGRRGADAFDEVLKGAIDALEFKWLQTQKRFETLDSDKGRRESILDFLQVVAEGVEARTVDVIQRGLLVNQVAHLLRMGREEVDRLMRRLGPRRHREKSRIANDPHTLPQAPEQAAWSQVLEVLLNDPSLLPLVEDPLAFERIPDPRDRRIGKTLLKLANKNEKVDLPLLLAQFQSSEDVDRIVSLAETGDRRGNFENTLRTAWTRIRSCMADAEMDMSAAQVDTDTGQAQNPDATQAKLAAVGKALRARRGFVPRRLSRRIDAVTSQSAIKEQQSKLE